ncbi:MAG: ABC transporter permease [bacterium]
MKGVIKSFGRIFLIREANILLAFIVLCAAVSIYAPDKFLNPFNIESVLRQVAFFGLLSIGETIVIITGGIDLSPGSVIAFIGVVVALFIKLGIPWPLAIVFALGISALIGLWHGIFVTKLRVPPFIITLGTLSMARGGASALTKGWPVTGLPESFKTLGTKGLPYLPIPFIILLVVFILAHIMMNYTVLGRRIYAIGGNIEAARLSGIDVDKGRILCYIISAFLAGLSGILIAANMGQGQPGVGSAYELQAIAGAVIGGTSLMGGEGTMLGTLLGTFIISVLYNALILLQVSPYWHEIVVGSVVVLAVTIDVLRRGR